MYMRNDIWAFMHVQKDCLNMSHCGGYMKLQKVTERERECSLSEAKWKVERRRHRRLLATLNIPPRPTLLLLLLLYIIEDFTVQLPVYSPPGSMHQAIKLYIAHPRTEYVLYIALYIREQKLVNLYIEMFFFLFIETINNSIWRLKINRHTHT